VQTPAAADPVQRIADTTEEMEVRSRFASHNARYFGVVFGFGALVAIINFLIAVTRREVVARKVLSVGLIALLAIAAVILCGYYMGRERRLALYPRLTAHFTDWLLILYVAVFIAIAFVSYRAPQTMMFWGTAYIWLLVLLRIPFDRRLIAHLVCFIVVIFVFQIVTTRHSNVPFYIGLSASHVIVILLGGYNSRRVRRETEGEWSVRRQHAKEQLRMRDELRYAREVQLSMLPDTSPELSWLDISAISVPATEVGGDYFDYLPVGENKLAIVSGDVAGHGLASGIVLSAVRAGFTLLRADLGRPSIVLRRLHEVVAQATRRRMLTTASILLFDRIARMATLANAGHPPLILRRSDGTVVALELFSPPLGVRLPIHVAERKVPFGPGDVFVVHSDGVYEARNSSGEHYGLEALEAIVSQVNHGATAEEFRDAIVRDVERFRDGAPQDDDMTVVVVRVL
jgi:hypothetical protein